MTGPAGRVEVARHEALVERLLGDDERAVEEAVADMYPAMFAVARGHVRNRTIAEEVVQETWLAARPAQSPSTVA